MQRYNKVNDTIYLQMKQQRKIFRILFFIICVDFMGLLSELQPNNVHSCILRVRVFEYEFVYCVCIIVKRIQNTKKYTEIFKQVIKVTKEVMNQKE